MSCQIKDRLFSPSLSNHVPLSHDSCVQSIENIVVIYYDIFFIRKSTVNAKP